MLTAFQPRSTLQLDTTPSLPGSSLVNKAKIAKLRTSVSQSPPNEVPKMPEPMSKKFAEYRIEPGPLAPPKSDEEPKFSTSFLDSVRPAEESLSIPVGRNILSDWDVVAGEAPPPQAAEYKTRQGTFAGFPSSMFKGFGLYTHMANDASPQNAAEAGKYEMKGKEESTPAEAPKKEHPLVVAEQAFTEAMQSRLMSELLAILYGEPQAPSRIEEAEVVAMEEQGLHTTSKLLGEVLQGLIASKCPNELKTNRFLKKVVASVREEVRATGKTEFVVHEEVPGAGPMQMEVHVLDENRIEVSLAWLRPPEGHPSLTTTFTIDAEKMRLLDGAGETTSFPSLRKGVKQATKLMKRTEPSPPRKRPVAGPSEKPPKPRKTDTTVAVPKKPRKVYSPVSKTFDSAQSLVDALAAKALPRLAAIDLALQMKVDWFDASHGRLEMTMLDRDGKQKGLFDFDVLRKGDHSIKLRTERGKNALSWDQTLQAIGNGEQHPVAPFASPSAEPAGPLPKQQWVLNFAEGQPADLTIHRLRSVEPSGTGIYDSAQFKYYFPGASQALPQSAIQSEQMRALRSLMDAVEHRRALAAAAESPAVPWEKPQPVVLHSEHGRMHGSQQALPVEAPVAQFLSKFFAGEAPNRAYVLALKGVRNADVYIDLRQHGVAGVMVQPASPHAPPSMAVFEQGLSGKVVEYKPELNVGPSEPVEGKGELVPAKEAAVDAVLGEVAEIEKATQGAIMSTSKLLPQVLEGLITGKRVQMPSSKQLQHLFEMLRLLQKQRRPNQVVEIVAEGSVPGAGSMQLALRAPDARFIDVSLAWLRSNGQIALRTSFLIDVMRKQLLNSARRPMTMGQLGSSLRSAVQFFPAAAATQAARAASRAVQLPPRIWEGLKALHSRVTEVARSRTGRRPAPPTMPKEEERQKMLAALTVECGKFGVRMIAVKRAQRPTLLFDLSVPGHVGLLGVPRDRLSPLRPVVLVRPEGLQPPLKAPKAPEEPEEPAPELPIGVWEKLPDGSLRPLEKVELDAGVEEMLDEAWLKALLRLIRAVDALLRIAEAMHRLPRPGKPLAITYEQRFRLTLQLDGLMRFLVLSVMGPGSPEQTVTLWYDLKRRAVAYGAEQARLAGLRRLMEPPRMEEDKKAEEAGEAGEPSGEPSEPSRPASVDAKGGLQVEEFENQGVTDADLYAYLIQCQGFHFSPSSPPPSMAEEEDLEGPIPKEDGIVLSDRVTDGPSSGGHGLVGCPPGCGGHGRPACPAGCGGRIDTDRPALPHSPAHPRPKHKPESPVAEAEETPQSIPPVAQTPPPLSASPDVVIEQGRLEDKPQPLPESDVDIEEPAAAHIDDDWVLVEGDSESSAADLSDWVMLSSDEHPEPAHPAVLPPAWPPQLFDDYMQDPKARPDGPDALPSPPDEGPSSFRVDDDDEVEGPSPRVHPIAQLPPPLSSSPVSPQPLAIKEHGRMESKPPHDHGFDIEKPASPIARPPATRSDASPPSSSSSSSSGIGALLSAANDIFWRFVPWNPFAGKGSNDPAPAPSSPSRQHRDGLGGCPAGCGGCVGGHRPAGEPSGVVAIRDLASGQPLERVERNRRRPVTTVIVRRRPTPKAGSAGTVVLAGEDLDEGALEIVEIGRQEIEHILAAIARLMRAMMGPGPLAIMNESMGAVAEGLGGLPAAELIVEANAEGHGQMQMEFRLDELMRYLLFSVSTRSLHNTRHLVLLYDLRLRMLVNRARQPITKQQLRDALNSLQPRALQNRMPDEAGEGGEPRAPAASPESGEEPSGTLSEDFAPGVGDVLSAALSTLGDLLGSYLPGASARAESSDDEPAPARPIGIARLNPDGSVKLNPDGSEATLEKMEEERPLVYVKRTRKSHADSNGAFEIIEEDVEEVHEDDEARRQKLRNLLALYGHVLCNLPRPRQEQNPNQLANLNGSLDAVAQNISELHQPGGQVEVAVEGNAAGLGHVRIVFRLDELMRFLSFSVSTRSLQDRPPRHFAVYYDLRKRALVNRARQPITLADLQAALRRLHEPPLPALTYVDDDWDLQNLFAEGDDARAPAAPAPSRPAPSSPASPQESEGDEFSGTLGEDFAPEFGDLLSALGDFIRGCLPRNPFRGRGGPEASAAPLGEPNPPADDVPPMSEILDDGTLRPLVPMNRNAQEGPQTTVTVRRRRPAPSSPTHSGSEGARALQRRDIERAQILRILVIIAHLLRAMQLNHNGMPPSHAPGPLPILNESMGAVAQELEHLPRADEEEVELIINGNVPGLGRVRLALKLDLLRFLLFTIRAWNGHAERRIPPLCYDPRLRALVNEEGEPASSEYVQEALRRFSQPQPVRKAINYTGGNAAGGESSSSAGCGGKIGGGAGDPQGPSLVPTSSGSGEAGCGGKIGGEVGGPQGPSNPLDASADIPTSTPSSSAQPVTSVSPISSAPPSWTPGIIKGRPARKPSESGPGSFGGCGGRRGGPECGDRIGGVAKEPASQGPSNPLAPSADPLASNQPPAAEPVAKVPPSRTPPSGDLDPLQSGRFADKPSGLGGCGGKRGGPECGDRIGGVGEALDDKPKESDDKPKKSDDGKAKGPALKRLESKPGELADDLLLFPESKVIHDESEESGEEPAESADELEIPVDFVPSDPRIGYRGDSRSSGRGVSSSRFRIPNRRKSTDELITLRQACQKESPPPPPQTAKPMSVAANWTLPWWLIILVIVVILLASGAMASYYYATHKQR